MQLFLRRVANIDWVLFSAVIPLLGAGLITMKGFSSGVNDLGLESGDYYFTRQIIWIFIALIIFFVFSAIDWRFLKSGGLLLGLLILSLIPLGFLLFFGAITRGAARWLHFFSLSVSPADPIKLLLILILAKYFSRRHVEIAYIKHILVSATYVIVPAGLVFLQPDFGSAIIICAIWFGMVAVSGISKKHLLIIFLTALLIFSIGWFFVLKPYQKDRVLTFFDPLRDPKGAGYNAMQSVIAVGSGEILGKGIGYGTQSRLEFLPEHQTDFIFASFAEEWGFLGVLVIFILWGIVIWRILKSAFNTQSNFERLFGIGLAIFFVSHALIHIGMNIGLLPVTGISLPFMSYGGSNLVTVFAGLGILMAMRRYAVNIIPEKSSDFIETPNNKSWL
jgi:rod shape determining protein RodA